MPLTPRGIWYPDGAVKASALDTLQQLAESVDNAVTESASRPWARARRENTTPQSIPHNTLVPLEYNRLEADTDGMWNPDQPTRLTIQTPGLYLIIWNSSFVGHATGVRRTYLRRNGTVVVQFYMPENGTLHSAFTGSYVQPLEVGDYIEAAQHQTSGTTLDTSSQPPPALTVVRLGDA